jgi:hypothetical protein
MSGEARWYHGEYIRPYLNDRGGFLYCVYGQHFCPCEADNRIKQEEEHYGNL